MAADAPATALEQTPGPEPETPTAAPQAPASGPSLSIDPAKLQREVGQLEAEADVAARVATSLEGFGPAVVRHMHLSIQNAVSTGQLKELLGKARAEVEADANMREEPAEEKLLATVALVLAESAKTADKVAKDSADNLRAQSNQMLGRAAAKRELLGAMGEDAG